MCLSLPMTMIVVMRMMMSTDIIFDEKMNRFVDINSLAIWIAAWRASIKRQTIKRWLWLVSCLVVEKQNKLEWEKLYFTYFSFSNQFNSHTEPVWIQNGNNFECPTKNSFEQIATKLPEAIHTDGQIEPMSQWTRKDVNQFDWAERKIVLWLKLCSSMKNNCRLMQEIQETVWTKHAIETKEHSSHLSSYNIQSYRNS